MGNEMGNQNVTGIAAEEDINTENTKNSFQEDVRRADGNGESKIVLEDDEIRDLNDKTKYIDSDSPLKGDPYADKESSEEKEQEQCEVQPASVIHEKNYGDSLPKTASLVEDASDHVKPIDSIPENGLLEKDDHFVDTQTSDGEDEKNIQPAVGQNGSTEDDGNQSQPALEDFRDNEVPVDASLETNYPKETSNDQDQQQQSGAIETMILENPSSASASLESTGLCSAYQDQADTRNGLALEGYSFSQQDDEGKLEVNLTLNADEASKLIDKEIAEILAEMVLTEVDAEYPEVDYLTIKELRSQGEKLLDMNIDEKSLGTEEGDENSMVANETIASATAELLGETANDKNMELLSEMHMDEKAAPLVNSMKNIEKVLIQEAAFLESESGGNKIRPNSLHMICDELLLLDTEVTQDSSELVSESNQNTKLEPEIFIIEINPENEEVKTVEHGHEFDGCSSERNFVYSDKSMEFEEMASKVDAVLTDDNFEEEDFIKKEINMERKQETEKVEYATENKTEGVENRNLHASESISNGLVQGIPSISHTSQVLPQDQWENFGQSELVSEDYKTPEIGGSESDPGRNKLVVTKLQKSPSFDFDLSTESRTEECDQTPLLYNEKSVIGSFSSKSDVENGNTLIHKTEYIEDSPRCQPMLVDEKQVKSVNSDPGKPRAPFLDLMKEEDKGKIMAKPQKDALVSARKNDKRKTRPSLFGTCICCAAMSVMH